MKNLFAIALLLAVPVNTFAQHPFIQPVDRVECSTVTPVNVTSTPNSDISPDPSILAAHNGFVARTGEKPRNFSSGMYYVQPTIQENGAGVLGRMGAHPAIPVPVPAKEFRLFYTDEYSIVEHLGCPFQINFTSLPIPQIQPKPKNRDLDLLPYYSLFAVTKTFDLTSSQEGFDTGELEEGNRVLAEAQRIAKELGIGDDNEVVHITSGALASIGAWLLRNKVYPNGPKGPRNAKIGFVVLSVLYTAVGFLNKNNTRIVVERQQVTLQNVTVINARLETIPIMRVQRFYNR